MGFPKYMYINCTYLIGHFFLFILLCASMCTIMFFLISLQLSQPGRLDRDDIPTLQNVAGIMDFVFDPFNNSRLVVGE